jgi:hypothetical protein
MNAELEEAKKKFPPIFTIYARMSEHPGKHVVRIWYGELAAETRWPCPTLEEARKLVQMWGAYMQLPRDFEDDAHIVESWI